MTVTHAALYFGAIAARERAEQENERNVDYSAYLMYVTAAGALMEAANATPPVPGTWDDEAVSHARWEAVNATQ